MVSKSLLISVIAAFAIPLAWLVYRTSRLQSLSSGADLLLASVGLNTVSCLLPGHYAKCFTCGFLRTNRWFCLPVFVVLAGLGAYLLHKWCVEAERRLLQVALSDFCLKNRSGCGGTPPATGHRFFWYAAGKFLLSWGVAIGFAIFNILLYLTDIV